MKITKLSKLPFEINTATKGHQKNSSIPNQKLNKDSSVFLQNLIEKNERFKNLGTNYKLLTNCCPKLGANIKNIFSSDKRREEAINYVKKLREHNTTYENAQTVYGRQTSITKLFNESPIRGSEKRLNFNGSIGNMSNFRGKQKVPSQLDMGELLDNDISDNSGNNMPPKKELIYDNFGDDEVSIDNQTKVLFSRRQPTNFNSGYYKQQQQQQQQQERQTFEPFHHQQSRSINLAGSNLANNNYNNSNIARSTKSIRFNEGSEYYFIDQSFGDNGRDTRGKLGFKIQSFDIRILPKKKKKTKKFDFETERFSYKVKGQEQKKTNSFEKDDLDIDQFDFKVPSKIKHKKSILLVDSFELNINGRHKGKLKKQSEEEFSIISISPRKLYKSSFMNTEEEKEDIQKKILLNPAVFTKSSRTMSRETKEKVELIQEKTKKFLKSKKNNRLENFDDEYSGLVLMSIDKGLKKSIFKLEDDPAKIEDINKYLASHNSFLKFIHLSKELKSFNDIGVNASSETREQSCETENIEHELSTTEHFTIQCKEYLTPKNERDASKETSFITPLKEFEPQLTQSFSIFCEEEGLKEKLKKLEDLERKDKKLDMNNEIKVEILQEKDKSFWNKELIPLNEGIVEYPADPVKWRMENLIGKEASFDLIGEKMVEVKGGLKSKEELNVLNEIALDILSTKTQDAKSTKELTIFNESSFDFVPNPKPISWRNELNILDENSFDLVNEHSKRPTSLSAINETSFDLINDKKYTVKLSTVNENSFDLLMKQVTKTWVKDLNFSKKSFEFISNKGKSFSSLNQLVQHEFNYISDKKEKELAKLEVSEGLMLELIQNQKSFDISFLQPNQCDSVSFICHQTLNQKKGNLVTSEEAFSFLHTRDQTPEPVTLKEAPENIPETTSLPEPEVVIEDEIPVDQMVEVLTEVQPVEQYNSVPDMKESEKLEVIKPTQKLKHLKSTEEVEEYKPMVKFNLAEESKPIQEEKIENENKLETIEGIENYDSASSIETSGRRRDLPSGLAKSMRVKQSVNFIDEHNYEKVMFNMPLKNKCKKEVHILEEPSVIKDIKKSKTIFTPTDVPTICNVIDKKPTSSRRKKKPKVQSFDENFSKSKEIELQNEKASDKLREKALLLRQKLRQKNK